MWVTVKLVACVLMTCFLLGIGVFSRGPFEGDYESPLSRCCEDPERIPQPSLEVVRSLELHEPVAEKGYLIR